jgi:hypothetical protein
VSSIEGSSAWRTEAISNRVAAVRVDDSHVVAIKVRREILLGGVEMKVGFITVTVP